MGHIMGQFDGACNACKGCFVPSTFKMLCFDRFAKSQRVLGIHIILQESVNGVLHMKIWDFLNVPQLVHLLGH